MEHDHFQDMMYQHMIAVERDLHELVIQARDISFNIKNFLDMYEEDKEQETIDNGQFGVGA